MILVTATIHSLHSPFSSFSKLDHEAQECHVDCSLPCAMLVVIYGSTWLINLKLSFLLQWAASSPLIKTMTHTNPITLMSEAGSQIVQEIDDLICQFQSENIVKHQDDTGSGQRQTRRRPHQLSIMSSWGDPMMWWSAALPVPGSRGRCGSAQLQQTKVPRTLPSYLWVNLTAWYNSWSSTEMAVHLAPAPLGEMVQVLPSISSDEQQDHSPLAAARKECHHL